MTDSLKKVLERREFLRRIGQGSAVLGLGGAWYGFSDALSASAAEELRPDGRPRLPPGQRALTKLKPMGGRPGSPNTSSFRLKLYGSVRRPKEWSFRELVALGEEKKVLDVHCVTGWSLLGQEWSGVTIQRLAEAAGVLGSARYVIIEAAHGYTANLPLDAALAQENMISWKIAGRRLGRAHGAPARALIPNRYFWKSAKWITGLRFQENDERGYWETRGYHNRADPWKEERFA
ncbi:MAG: molybdopterin-dependent oxidoreductase [Polyangiaceae bacterium]|nr:molybdopterin-dependent oxidoreductase [Polyangiaceae bacterium]